MPAAPPAADVGSIPQATDLRTGNSRLRQTTPIPDEFIDRVMADCKGAEVKVALYLYRRTVGFGKTSDEVSLDQICNGIRRRDGSVLDRGTGLSKDTAQLAADAIVTKGIFDRKRGNGPHAHVYTVRSIMSSAAPAPAKPDISPELKKRRMENLKKRWEKSNANSLGASEKSPVPASEKVERQAFENVGTQETATNPVSQQTAIPEHYPLFESSVKSGGTPSKLITGDESQKPAIRAPGSPAGVCDYVAKNPNPKADRPAAPTTAEQEPPAGGPTKPLPGKPNPETFPNIAATAWETQLAHLRVCLAAYMGEEPPPDFEQSCLLRARGASVSQIEELLDRRWAKEKYRPGGKREPRKWNWFLQVIGNEFSSIEAGRMPEAAARPHPSHTVSPDELARGIEALEQSDANDSLVRSYACKCGVQIREYVNRIEGSCTCSVKRAPPGRVESTKLSQATASQIAAALERPHTARKGHPPKSPTEASVSTCTRCRGSGLLHPNGSPATADSGGEARKILEAGGFLCECARGRDWWLWCDTEWKRPEWKQTRASLPTSTAAVA